MSYKFNAGILTDPMKYNHIVFNGNKLQMHNYDAESIGVIMQHKLETEAPEVIDLILNEKDYVFISKLGEVEIEVAEKEIKIKAGKSKFKFARLVDVPNFEPDLSEMELISIPYPMIDKGNPFIGKVAERPQYNGINVLKEAIVVSNAVSRIRMMNNSGSQHEINIPGTALKYMHDSEKLKFMTNGRLVVCSTPGRKFYSKLIANQLENKDLNFELLNIVKLSVNELKKQLLLIREYCDIATFTIKDNAMTVQAKTNEQDFDLDVKINKAEGENIRITFNIRQFILCLNALEKEEIEIEFMTNAMRIMDVNDDELMLPIYGQIEREVQ